MAGSRLLLTGLLSVLFSSVSAMSSAQNRDSVRVKDTSHYKYMGFDANPLMSQILPLNRITLDSRVFSIVRRNYRGNFGYRVSYGIGISDQLDLQFFSFMLGFDRRREISPRWYYFNGLDMVIRAFNDNGLIGQVQPGQTSGFGIGSHWGVEYRLGKVVSLSTEANLTFLLLTDTDSPDFILQPPMNLTAHFNITRK